jgi:hypothetical protein
VCAVCSVQCGYTNTGLPLSMEKKAGQYRHRVLRDPEALYKEQGEMPVHAVQSSLPAIVEEEATVLQSVAPTTVHVKNKTEQCNTTWRREWCLSRTRQISALIAQCTSKRDRSKR